jgi:hypothetical protein
MKRLLTALLLMIEPMVAGIPGACICACKEMAILPNHQAEKSMSADLLTFCKGRAGGFPRLVILSHR